MVDIIIENKTSDPLAFLLYKHKDRITITVVEMPEEFEDKDVAYSCGGAACVASLGEDDE